MISARVLRLAADWPDVTVSTSVILVLRLFGHLHGICFFPFSISVLGPPPSALRSPPHPT